MNKQAYYMYKVASINKLAADPKYTQEDFDRLVKEYESNKRGDMPDVATQNDMFNARLDQRKPEIDAANKRIAKAYHRANGFNTYATGIGGMMGFGAGGLLANLINGYKPDWDQYQKKKKTRAQFEADLAKWKKNKWQRWLTGAALRGGGFLLGGAVPYLLNRAGEGVWDAGAAGINYAAGKLGGTR